MKKFTAIVLTFAMVLCMACTVFASSFDGTTLTVDDPTYENFVTISNSVFDGHADSETVVITLTVRDHFAADPGYCWCTNDSTVEGYEWWSNSVAGTQCPYPGEFAVDGETAEITYTVADLKAMMVAGDGLVLNCWNGIVPTNIVLGSGAAPTGDATPVAALAVMALISCAAMVVLRKKEA